MTVTNQQYGQGTHMLRYAFKSYVRAERHEDSFHKDDGTREDAVILGRMADGSHLSPFIILKRKTLPKGAKFPGSVVVRAHPKRLMDESGTSDWLDTVWGKQKGALLKKSSILVWDSIRAH